MLVERNICQDMKKTVSMTSCSFRLGKMRSFHFSLKTFFDIAVHCFQRETFIASLDLRKSFTHSTGNHFLLFSLPQRVVVVVVVCCREGNR